MENLEFLEPGNSNSSRAGWDGQTLGLAGLRFEANTEELGLGFKDWRISRWMKNCIRLQIQCKIRSNEETERMNVNGRTDEKKNAWEWKNGKKNEKWKIGWNGRSEKWMKWKTGRSGKMDEIEWWLIWNNIQNNKRIANTMDGKKCCEIYEMLY